MNKGLLSITMCAALAAVPFQAWAAETETQDQAAVFAQIAREPLYYSSGAGGWYAELIIDADGSFTGIYHDSEMGEFGDGYPDGTVYESAWKGQLAVDSQTSEKSWKLTVESLETEDEEGQERIEDEIRYVTTVPVGLKAGDTLELFAPGYPVADLPEDFLFWTHLNFYDPEPEELPFYGIYNESEDSGFVSGESSDLSDETEAIENMINPWTETDAKDFAKTMGTEIRLPEGAKDVVYRLLNGGEMGEIIFTLDDTQCTVRCKADKSWEDISGLYYEDWDSDEKCTIKGFEGVLRVVRDEALDTTITNCMWLDTEAGMMYCVTAEAADPAGFDAVALAESLYTAS